LEVKVNSRSSGVCAKKGKQRDPNGNGQGRCGIGLPREQPTENRKGKDIPVGDKNAKKQSHVGKKTSTAEGTSGTPHVYATESPKGTKKQAKKKDQVDKGVRSQHQQGGEKVAAQKGMKGRWPRVLWTRGVESKNKGYPKKGGKEEGN